MKTRTRFAPSPTGYLHIGSLRTALYAYFFARSTGGDFILRIEDTDQARTVADATQKLIEVFDDFNIERDEGPELSNGEIIEKGDHGPYIQSQRSDIYKKYAEQLITEGKAYYAFETSEELDALRKDQEKKGLPPRYNKAALNLSKEEIQKNLDEGKPYVVRLNVTPGKMVEFTDAVFGKIRVNSKDIDDQVLLKSDGHATYHLANVVDDHLMKITHVIRGEEWVPSTPKHILLYEAFGWEPPTFAHLSLILNNEKAKLSKRHGDVSVEDFVNKGYLKDALINFVMLLGWNPKNDQEIFSIEEFKKIFKLEHINKSGAVFNREKLEWINKQHIKELDDDAFFELAKPYLASFSDTEENMLKAASILEKERIAKLSELPEAIGFLFALPEYAPELLAWKKLTKEEAQENLSKLKPLVEETTEEEFNQDALNKKIYTFIKDNEYKVGNFLWPLRVALSGKERSPGPYEIAEVIGKEESLKRINHALSL